MNKIRLVILTLLLFLCAAYFPTPFPGSRQSSVGEPTRKPFVTGQAAYAHYMPPNYGLRVVYCEVQWPDGMRDEYVVMAWRQCSMHAALARDPSQPIQWDPYNVRMLAENPN